MYLKTGYFCNVFLSTVENFKLMLLLVYATVTTSTWSWTWVWCQSSGGYVLSNCSKGLFLASVHFCVDYIHHCLWFALFWLLFPSVLCGYSSFCFEKDHEIYDIFLFFLSWILCTKQSITWSEIGVGTGQNSHPFQFMIEYNFRS